MHELDKFRIIYKLKSIYRLNSVDNRHESTAEHTWSALMLADWILTESRLNVDRLKIYELIMYHDLVEIYAGNTPINSETGIANQSHSEHTAFEKLIKELPSSMIEKYKSLYIEFEERKTIEAKFAMAINQLDASIHEMDHKKDWKGWTEDFMREKKTKYYAEFPIMMEIFEEFLKYCNENKFFEQ